MAKEEITLNESYQDKIENNGMMKNLSRIASVIPNFSLKEPHTLFQKLSDENIEIITRYVLAVNIAMRKAGYISEEDIEEAESVVEKYRN